MRLNVKNTGIAALLAALCLSSCGPKYMEPSSAEGSQTEFAASFFRNVLSVSGKDENICVSPYSAGMAFSMVAEGALGQTREDMLKALNGCVFKAEDLGGNDTVVVNSVNSLWIDNDFAIRDRYVSLMQKDFDALATALDFSDPSTVQAINNWCSEHTSGRIERIIGRLSPNDVLVLANALYFKAPWLWPFPGHATVKDVFHGSKGDTETEFMQQKRYYRYAAYQGSEMVQLPYEGERYAMTLILPSKELGMDGLMEYMTGNNMETALSRLEPVQIMLRMPKFRMETDMQLNKTLSAMGAGSVFSQSADLGGIALGPLSLSSVVQKTFIEVDEKGSEAAAVTAAVVGLTSAPVRPAHVMNMDRPFCFMLSDVQTGRILFMGRVMNL